LGGSTPVIVALAYPVVEKFVPPSVEVTFPLTLFFGPPVVTVTATLNVQLLLAAIVPPLKARVLGAVRVRVPLVQTVEVPEVTVNPAGRISVKATLFSTVPLFGLVSVKVSVEVPLTGTIAGEKLLVIVGGLGGMHPVNVTLSISKLDPGLSLPALYK